MPRADPFSEPSAYADSPNCSVAHSSPGANAIDQVLNLRFSVMCARALHSYGAVVKRSRSRFCKISYSSAAAAALTPSDSIAPAQRQRDQLVAGPGHARAQAAALAAEHEHDPGAAVVGRVVGDRRVLAGGLGAGPVAPAARRSRPAPRKSARLRTRATRRCSTRSGRGLADRRRDLGRAALGDRPRRCSPAHSAVRQIEPRFCGSWTWSSATTQRLRTGQQLLRRRRTGSRRPARTPPGARRSRSGARSPRPQLVLTRTPASHGSRAALCVAHTSPTLCARRPRSASRTGLRP